MGHDWLHIETVKEKKQYRWLMVPKEMMVSFIKVKKKERGSVLSRKVINLMLGTLSLRVLWDH